jgi:hypothetical protein
MIRIEGIPAVAARLLGTVKFTKAVETSAQTRRKRPRQGFPRRRQLSRRASR